MMKHIGYVLYGVFSTLESFLNLLLYISFAYKAVSVLDLAMPFFFWWTNKFCKKNFKKEMEQRADAIIERINDVEKP